MKPVLYLIDGHAQIFRAYYAMESLKSRQGEPTGAAYGFTRILTDLITKHQPAGIIAVFDAPGPTFRNERYAEYKANRKPTPPELIQQVPVIKDIVAGYRIPVCCGEGFEADDILGSLTRQAVAEGWDVVLVTGDKDCAQLLRDGVRIYDPMKDVYIDEKSFTEKKGLPPDKLVDLMGLWGDTSDNIPGVPGIGEKIGVQLIQQYGTLENLLDHADEVKGKRGEVLRANKEQALLSKELATIDVNAPVKLDFEEAKPKPPDMDKLRELFLRLDFRTLLTKLETALGTPASDAAVDDNDAPRAARKESVEYQVINDPTWFDAFVKMAAKQRLIAVKVQICGQDPLRSRLAGIAFSWHQQAGYYLPFRVATGDTALAPEFLEKLKPLLEDPAIAKTGYNIRSCSLALRQVGITLRGIVSDSLIAASLVDGHLVDHSLGTIARRYLDVETVPIEDLIGSGKNQKTLDLAPLAQVTAFASAEADVAYRLHNVLSERLDNRDARRLFDEVEMPLSGVLTEMQATGITVDCDLLAAESAETGEMLEDLTKEIYGLAGHPFNIGSPKQLAVVLFEEMNLPVIRKTQTGVSTDESVLQELAHIHNSELAERILEYRQYAKLKNTYLDTLPKLVNPASGRVHTSFSQVRTATGRLASSNPNLQNIPVRTERGRTIRAAFVPRQGWKMLAADYSQVELRVLASFSEDPTLARAFAEGMDIHRVVAAEVNGIGADEVTSEMRSAAKAVNFGIIYGQSAHGLAASTGMSRASAQRFIDNYFERFPKVREWIRNTIALAEKNGYVETILKFRREIPDIRATNRMRKARGEREAVNTIIQGSAADLIKTAMVRLAEALSAHNFAAKMLLQIHDELLLEFPPEEEARLIPVVEDAMENAIPMSVPLKVDVGVGANWLETK